MLIVAFRALPHMSRVDYYKKLINHLPAGVIVSDSDTRVIYANRAAEDILKLSQHHLKKIRLHERVHPEDQPKVRQYAKILKSKKHMLTKRRFKDGNDAYIYIERNTRLLPDGTQLSLCRDISGEVDMNTRYDHFVLLAEHELRNPLTGIQIYTDLLARLCDRPHDMEARTYLDRIQEEISRQNRMISDLSNLSELERGTLTLRMHYFKLYEFLSEIVFQMQNRTLRKFTLHCPVSLRKEVYGDKDRLYQVFINLLRNAVKYSKRPTPVELAVKRRGGLWYISVRDYGIGIKKENQEAIFEKFFQVEKNSASGLGIGLYLSSHIIRAHQGTLGVKSILGKGSIFTAALPLKP